MANFPRPFGKYDLIASLGRGGMADVFLAILRGPSAFNKLLVIKATRSFVEDDERFRQMLLDEARLAARLHHPNVVQTLDVGEVNGRPFIGMEYLNGQSLNVIIASARDAKIPIGAALATEIIREALAGLHYSHELKDYDGAPLNIVHRDVSPHNVFVTYEGEVKIVDFGVAKAKTNLALTEAGSVKGKVAYMAPEQARGEPLDRRADIFAAGLVLWEMLSSRRMLDGDSMASVLQRLLCEPLPALKTVCPDIDPELDAIVARALAKDPKERFQTALEMREALGRFSQEVRRDDVGKRVCSMFEAERATRQAQIQECMRPTEAVYDEPTLTVAGRAILPSDLEAQTVAIDSSKSNPSQVRSTISDQTLAPNARTSSGTQGPKRFRTVTLALAATGFMVTALGLYGASQLRHASATDSESSVASAKASIAVEEVILRLQGSETMGHTLAPRLVEAFLKHKDTKIAVRNEEVKDETRVIATLAGKPTQIIEIISHGSATAFSALGSHQCDIGMSSRAITDQEWVDLKQMGLGDLKSPVSEHVVAFDGVAVIVNSKNPLRSLSIQQITGVVSGQTVDWATLETKGPATAKGPIDLYMRDDNSGTNDVVKEFIGMPHLVPKAKRIADNEQLSDAVAADPKGIGFVGVAYVRHSKALGVKGLDGPVVSPTASTVASGTYPLSRKLYLYTAEGSQHAISHDFVDFVLSPEGQKEVRAAGFVELHAKDE